VFACVRDLQVFDPKGSLHSSIPCKDVTCVASDGAHLYIGAAVTSGPSVRVYDLSSRAEVRSFGIASPEVLFGGCKSICFTTDGSGLLVAGDAGRMHAVFFDKSGTHLAEPLRPQCLTSAKLTFTF
jgi:hypothetical protein